MLQSLTNQATRVPDGTQVSFIGAIITSPKSVLFTERNTP